MNRLIMIKYGELTTKKANRKFFIEMLSNNIKKILKDIPYIMKKDRVRMYIECNEENLDTILKKLKLIFGIHGIVVCHKVNNNTEDIKEKVLELIKNRTGTFKVETKRADKSFEIHSMDFNRIIGGYILKTYLVK